MRAGDSGSHQGDREAAQPQSQDHSGVSLRSGSPGGFEHQKIRLGDGHDIATLGNDVPEGRAGARDGRIWGRSPFFFIFLSPLYFKQSSVNLCTCFLSLFFLAQVGHFVYRARKPFHPLRLCEEFLFQYFVIKNEVDEQGEEEEGEEEEGEEEEGEGEEEEEEEEEEEGADDDKNGDEEVDSD